MTIEPVTADFEFTVLGEAKPAGSKRAFPLKTGKIVVTDTSGKAGKDWRRSVAEAASEVAPSELLRGPLSVQMIFYRPRPKGHYGTGKNSGQVKQNAPDWPTTRPDVLKLARAAEDACTGVLWADDSQIVLEFLQKAYGEPARLEVRVNCMDLETS